MSRHHDPMDGLLLAETLAVRLCHDLSGQVNALTGCMEILREEADPEALALAGDAADMLARRLRLARAAWGRTGGPMSVAEWRQLAEALARRNVVFALDEVDPTEHFAPAAARLTLNLLILAAESLPAGGVIEVAGQPGQDLMVRISGPRAAWPAGLAGMLADPDLAWESLRQADPTMASRALQAPLTALIAHAEGLRISMLMGPQAEAAPPLLVTLAPHA
jgi:histidine phosphotransferase ChpT